MNKRYVLAVVGAVTLLMLGGALLVNAAPSRAGAHGVDITWGTPAGWDGHESNIVTTTGPTWIEVSYDWASVDPWTAFVFYVPITVTNYGDVAGLQPVVSRIVYYTDYCPQWQWSTWWDTSNCSALALDTSNPTLPQGTTSRVNTTVGVYPAVQVTQNIDFIGGFVALESKAGSQFRGLQTTFSMVHVHFRWEIVSIGGLDMTHTIATPYPQGQMPCITATVAVSPTAGPTMTPISAPTRTPGGPTLTPTPSPTATISHTVQNTSTVSYDSGVIGFDHDVAPLSAFGDVNDGSPQRFLQWSSVAGQDGKPGVAFMHAGIGNVITLTASEAITNGIIAMFKPGGYIAPVGVTFWARTAYTQTNDMVDSIRVWYLDPDYAGPGHGVWVTTEEGWPSSQKLSNVWREFGFVVNTSGGSGHISALAISEELSSGGPPDTTPCPLGGGGLFYGCMYLDNLRITYGAANNLQFAICGTEGAGGGGTNRPGKICVLTNTSIDVYSACHTPALLTDIGGWISWIYCRISTYFKFLDQNRAQMEAMQTSQNEVEPFGSIAELGGVFTSVSGELDTLQQQNRSNGAAPFDISNMMSLAALDQSPDLHVVTSPSFDYIAQCPAELINQNTTAIRGACMSVYLLRTTSAVQMIQLVLNGAFIIMLIYVTIATIHSLAKA